jgi:hypothetical protein
MAKEEKVDIFKECMESEKETLEDLAKVMGIKGLDFNDQKVKETFCRIVDGLAGPSGTPKGASRFLPTI